MSTSNFTREIPAMADTISAQHLKTTVRNKHDRVRSHSLLSQETRDLIDIWLGSPGVLKILDKYLDRQDRVLLAVKHLVTMNFESGASDFYTLLPLILLIVASSALGAYLDAIHGVFGAFLTFGCCFSANCMFTFAGHSVLHLGEVMDRENVSKTRVDTDVFGALAFLEVLASGSLGQLIIFALLGGYLGALLSLLVTLAMLAAATTMNHARVCLTIYDERLLQTAAQAEKWMKIDENNKKIAKLESTIEGLHLQLHTQQQKSDEQEQANISLRAAEIQNQQELQRHQTARRNESAAAGKLLETNRLLQETNKLLQDALAEANKSHDEALATKARHYAEEFAKEKAHVETLARENMLVELRRMIVAHNATTDERYAKAGAVMQQKYNGALAKKDKEHADALARKEKQHQEVLRKEKGEAQAAGRREAINYCKQFHESNMQAAEQRHMETLADAVAGRNTFHKEALVTKEKEHEEEMKKLKDSYAESHERNMRFYDGFIQDERNEHARTIAEKDQRLADMKAQMDRYPELWLAEDDSKNLEDSESGEDDEDEGYITMIDNEEARSRNEEGIEFQADEDAGSQDHEYTESEYDQASIVDYAGTDAELCVDGDDSEDELRQWALVDSDAEQD